MSPQDENDWLKKWREFFNKTSYRTTTETAAAFGRSCAREAMAKGRAEAFKAAEKALERAEKAESERDGMRQMVDGERIRRKSAESEVTRLKAELSRAQERIKFLEVATKRGGASLAEKAVAFMNERDDARRETLAQMKSYEAQVAAMVLDKKNAMNMARELLDAAEGVKNQALREKEAAESEATRLRAENKAQYDERCRLQAIINRCENGECPQVEAQDAELTRLREMGKAKDELIEAAKSALESSITAGKLGGRIVEYPRFFTLYAALPPAEPSGDAKPCGECDGKREVDDYRLGHVVGTMPCPKCAPPVDAKKEDK